MINQARLGSLTALLNQDPDEIGLHFERGASREASQQFRWFQNQPGGSKPSGVPLLLFNKRSKKGELGWLNVISGMADAARLSGDMDQSAARLLEILSVFHGPNSGRPGIHCQAPSDQTQQQIEGTSGTLAVLLDWLFSILKIEPETHERCELGRWAATGSWSFDSGSFTPVQASTLTPKALAALRWGYHTLILLENQDLPSDFPEDKIRIIRVPCQPVEAAFTLLEQPECVSILKKNALRAETVINTLRGVWINDPEKRTQAAPRLINLLHDHALETSNPTLQALTGDLLLREAFYTENTVNVSRYWPSITPPVLAESRFLLSPTCTYFRYEQATMIAKFLIDHGYWDDSEVNDEYSEVMASLVKRADRKTVPKWDVPTHFGIFALNNLLSHRELFLSRIQDNEERALELVNGCLNRRLLYRDMWQDFWTSHGHRKDTYPERQINQLVEVWWELRRFCKTPIAEQAQNLTDEIKEAIEQLESQTRQFPFREPNYWDNLGRWTRAYLTENEEKLAMEKHRCMETAKKLISKRDQHPGALQSCRSSLERMVITESDMDALEMLNRITKPSSTLLSGSLCNILVAIRSELIIRKHQGELPSQASGNKQAKTEDHLQKTLTTVLGNSKVHSRLICQALRTIQMEDLIEKGPY